MVFHPEPGCVDRYTIRMMSRNQISGLLPFQEKWMNGENRYYYDITSKQPLGRLLEYRNMTGEEIHAFVSGFLNAMRQMERFLLDENQICLEPEYIYVEPESFQCTLMLIPGKYENFTDGFRALCQYLLDYVNQNDGNAVILAFSVFKESQKENFGMEDIGRCLQQTERNVLLEDYAGGNEPSKHVVKNTETQEVLPVSVYREKENDSGLRYEDIFASEDSRYEETLRREKQGRSLRFVPFACVVGMILLPILMILTGGMERLIQFKWYLLGIEVLSVCGIALFWDRREEGDKTSIFQADKTPILQKDDRGVDIKKTRQPFKDVCSWEREEEADPAQITIPEEESWNREQKEDNLQTVLLTARPVSGKSRCLVPVGGGEEILIRYFPFLIGKKKGIVDFCLNESGISRLHIKLEEDGDRYYVTDLNSTNGTMVDGVWLEANERKELPIGGELILAASRFYFR